MRKVSLSNIRDAGFSYYKKAASLISNKNERDKIIKFLNLYIVSEYIAKTIQILLDGNKLTESNYINTSIEPNKIKKYYCHNGYTFDYLQYVFNAKSYKKKVM